MANVPKGVKTLSKISIAEGARTLQTDRQAQTDRRQTTDRRISTLTESLKSIDRRWRVSTAARCAHHVRQEAHQEMRQRTWTVLRRHPARTTKYNRLVHILWHRHTVCHTVFIVNRKQKETVITAKKITVKRSLNDKLQVSNGEIYSTTNAWIYTVSGKKGATLFLPVTLRNANRFSKFFYHHTLQ